MAYQLEDFCTDAREALAADPGHDGREKVRRYLEKLLANEDFVARHLGAEVEGGKRVLYHDEDTDFYVMAHGTEHGNRVGKPHDHGASWAIYGQSKGVTDMTVYKRTDDGRRDGHAELDTAETFRLDPGVVALFDDGAIHSTAHPEPARWVRVTGTDLDTIKRHRYDREKQTLEAMNPAI